MSTAKIVTTPSDKFLIPVFKLLNSNVVLSPGILYKINFNNRDGSKILNYFKAKSDRINNHLLRNSFPDIAEELSSENHQNNHNSKDNTVQMISDDSVRSSRSLKKFLNNDETSTSSSSTGNQYDWLLCGVLSKHESSYLTIVRIVGVTFDESSKSYVITFQGITRGKISPEEQGFPKDCLTEVASNNVEIKDEVLTGLVADFNGNMKALFEVISQFIQVAAENKEHGESKAGSLSPLFQILALQLNNAEYLDSESKLKALITKFNDNYHYETTAKNTQIYLKLLDLSIAILPVSSLQFLKEHDIHSRILKFTELITQFQEIFKVLDTALSYVDEFNASSTDLEKSKIISTQLKSIRHSIDVISPELKKGNNNNKPTTPSDPELSMIAKFIENSIPTPSIKLLLMKDLNRLLKMAPQNSEYQVLRNYFDIIMDIPFGKYESLKEFELTDVQKRLDLDHFGLHKVKKRLLQYVSVLKLIQMNEQQQHEKHRSDQQHSNPDTQAANEEDLIVASEGKQQQRHQKPQKQPVPSPQKQSKSPIILLVGPPGVGKTSLAQSIASSLGRKFQRISLGGVRDESSIRGHRRTYVGSMPGLIITALRKAGTMNPVLLLDEIDKLSGGVNSTGKVNGDPEAALLEVLDPEQNWNFMDHYLGFEIDLSQVLFICTANELGSISSALRDRLEVIELSGYTFEEKQVILQKFLLPKQIKVNGMELGNVLLNDTVSGKLIREYVRESGVRNLERLVAGICRGKAVEYINSPETYDSEVKELQLIKYLGLPRFPVMKALLETPESSISEKYGIVNGLSYNSSGVGDVLLFEVILIRNEKLNETKLQMTGNLGKTLTESVRISISFLRSILSRRLLSNVDCQTLLSDLSHSELNIHVPSGGVEKDGPSAGITITLAILSTLLHLPVPSNIAMTGEISLRGKVLPIGGIIEKLQGAAQYGLNLVLVPLANQRDVIEGFVNDDLELMAFVKDPNEGVGVVKKRVWDRLGVKIEFVETFWDVLRFVWQGRDQVSVKEEDQIVRSSHI
ncbi:hypothetical protein WICPIJ_007560 [Wickerhamomyces pijperi]|uniref:endopeptidase La n=1 Tax=Wickerhamomyces pijperi TaxID=599730 RepID=A0A9P8TJT9_WICPI|nr:hypothetical protein WICPIJ_007560 [Wickerhamomyces pijperi]